MSTKRNPSQISGDSYEDSYEDSYDSQPNSMFPKVIRHFPRKLFRTAKTLAAAGYAAGHNLLNKLDGKEEFDMYFDHLDQMDKTKQVLSEGASEIKRFKALSEVTANGDTLYNKLMTEPFSNQQIFIPVRKFLDFETLKLYAVNFEKDGKTQTLLFFGIPWSTYLTDPNDGTVFDIQDMALCALIDESGRLKSEAMPVSLYDINKDNFDVLLEVATKFKRTTNMQDGSEEYIWDEDLGEQLKKAAIENVLRDYLGLPENSPLIIAEVRLNYDDPFILALLVNPLTELPVEIIQQFIVANRIEMTNKLSRLQNFKPTEQAKKDDILLKRIELIMKRNTAANQKAAEARAAEATIAHQKALAQALAEKRKREGEFGGSLKKTKTKKKRSKKHRKTKKHMNKKTNKHRKHRSNKSKKKR